eukprot:6205310-Pleurochrysis_carterae.AAC.1
MSKSPSRRAFGPRSSATRPGSMPRSRWARRRPTSLPPSGQSHRNDAFLRAFLLPATKLHATPTRRTSLQTLRREPRLLP